MYVLMLTYRPKAENSTEIQSATRRSQSTAPPAEATQLPPQHRRLLPRCICREALSMMSSEEGLPANPSSSWSFLSVRSWQDTALFEVRAMDETRTFDVNPRGGGGIWSGLRRRRDDSGAGVQTFSTGFFFFFLLPFFFFFFISPPPTHFPHLAVRRPQ